MATCTQKQDVIWDVGTGMTFGTNLLTRMGETSRKLVRRVWDGDGGGKVTAGLDVTGGTTMHRSTARCWM
jgi:hypothetical protein